MGNPEAIDDGLDEQLGYDPELRWLREQVPDYDALRRGLLRRVFAPDEAALALKYREMIAALVAAARSSELAEAHFRRAIAAGASMGELIEATQIAERPGGSTMFHMALAALRKIDAESAPLRQP